VKAQRAAAIVICFDGAVGRFATRFPSVTVRPGRRFVDNGKLMTAAGASAASTARFTSSPERSDATWQTKPPSTWSTAADEAPAAGSS
jgi:hypothetical protein